MAINKKILIEQLENILKRMEQDRHTISRYIQLFKWEISNEEAEERIKELVQEQSKNLEVFQ